jgi:SAM-dependent methyltransferase
VTTDRWTGGDAYDRFIGRWSRLVGREFIDWLAIPTASTWVDVGCGTGALSQTILERAAPTSVLGVDPSADFIGHARATIHDERARFEVGSADRLPVADGSAEAVVAGLVLNFVPDVGAALSEMRRATRREGTVAGYVWDYAGAMELLRKFWDAAITTDPNGAAAAEDEGNRFPICAPSPLNDAFAAAGLGDVRVEAIEVPTSFADFDDLWSPFLSAVGPAPGYVARLDEAGRGRLRARLEAELQPADDGSIHLTARAWAARGSV